MKVSILLPYKENYSPSYAGAVSLFVNESTTISKYKKNIKVYGNTIYKKKFNNYFNLSISNKKFISKNYNYVKNFTKQNEVKNSDIIEIHNRPIYLKYIINENINTNFVVYFHNDPLNIKGSETIKERLYILEKSTHVIFISQWLKKQFFKGIDINKYNHKILIISHSAKKNKVNFAKKQNYIMFVGKLNSSKGYDIFGKSLIKILDKYQDWSAIVIGDEPREKIIFKHKRFFLKGFKSHEEVIKFYKISKIAVTCSRWEEPLGRGGIEASANGCAPIVSDRGGLSETVTDGIIMKNLNVNTLYQIIEKLIKNKNKLLDIQKKSYANFYLSHEFINAKIDKYRDKLDLKLNYNNFSINKLKILHITNFNQRHFGRLHYNTGKRINNGFTRLGHNVLAISDRDITFFTKSFTDPSGSKSLQKYILNNFTSFMPDILVLGHADRVSLETLTNLKKINKDLKIIQWFLDPVSKKGPDYKKNKDRILNNIDIIDATYLTTSPDCLEFKIKNSFFIPNPCDSSFETLKNYEKDCYYDIFFAMSHGVHRGVLKQGKFDEREIFIKRILNKTPNLRYDLYGLDDHQPVWGNDFLKAISNSKMGINLSRGKPVKYYSSDRIVQLVGNGLLTFIHKDSRYQDFFSNNEMIFYNNDNDLVEKLYKYKKDNKLRIKIAKNGRDKYHKYFNSTLVSKFMINKIYDKKDKQKFLWEV